MSSLQEVSHNWVVISHISSLYQSFKSSKSKSISHTKEVKTILNSLHSAVIALHSYNDTVYTAIEAKTYIKKRTVNAIVQHAKKALNSHNINELLETEAAEKKDRHSMIAEGSVRDLDKLMSNYVSEQKKRQRVLHW